MPIQNKIPFFKKTILIVLLFFACNFIFSQSFQKGNFDISTGIGIGLYGVASNDINEVPETGINTAKILFPVNVNYFILDRLSVGLSMQYNNIPTNLDSTNTYARTINFGINSKILLLNSSNDIVFLDLCLGHSEFIWRNRKKIDGLNGYGYFYHIGFGFNHYFNNSLGFYFHGAYAVYQYNMLYNNRDLVITVKEGIEPLIINLSGFNLTTGFCLKF